MASPCTYSARAYHRHSSRSGAPPSPNVRSGASAFSQSCTTAARLPCASDCCAERTQSSGSRSGAPPGPPPSSSSFTLASVATRAGSSTSPAASSSSRAYAPDSAPVPTAGSLTPA
eukprot:scaffold40390_cov26-Tisochrysis_lutea.AAC.5